MADNVRYGCYVVPVGVDARHSFRVHQHRRAGNEKGG